MYKIDLNSTVDEAEKALEPIFKRIDKISEKNTKKVMDAFKTHRVSESMFAASSGYGYNDLGRDTLEKVYAEVFGAEAALVRHSILSGTHALTIGLFGLLRPGDIMLSVTGKPYDTLDEVIGINGANGDGSLADFGVIYKEVGLDRNGLPDIPAIKSALLKYGDKVKMVYIQRSKGYMDRPTLTVSQIGDLIKEVRSVGSKAYVVCDNCYGEFTEEQEPTAVGADLIIGSLIKNPGGGMAESGGYLAGSAKAIELCSYRFSSVGSGSEVGATLGNNKAMYKGFFYAPHTVAQALKVAHLAAYIFEKMGFETEPSYSTFRSDIIQSVKCGSADALIAFCRGIQYGSPVDSFVTCEPWDMPGYSDPVIMAAGNFTQGSSIELSADGPVRPPYTAFFQGSLTYESGKIGIISAAEQVMKLSD